jgi:hypothetical protein
MAKRTVKTKFYTYRQNNSGGSFSKDNDVSEYVIIEAKDASEADSIAETVGIYFYGCRKQRDCSCCGDRWYHAQEVNASDKPSVYSTKMNETTKAKKDWNVVIHYYDGKKEYHRY